MITCEGRDWWTCDVTEPDSSWDGQHYMCYRCGEVFIQDTFEVVDRIDAERRRKNDEFFAAS